MAAEPPLVSIIIPCHHQVERLQAALAALRSDGCGAIDREVIVLLNGTGDGADALTSGDLIGVNLLRSAVNLGFGAGCNYAAEQARGRLLVFLNDDAVVEPGWLDELVRAAAECPTAGAIGGRILHEDGSLQEAGSILWSDGWTEGVGCELPPGSTEWRYRRAVDYCSACMLLVRRAAWEAAGGFDEGYERAYFEDVDLCMALRQKGWQVLYEPGAVAKHCEHASSDRRMVEMLFRANWSRFQTKWATALHLQEVRGENRRADQQRAALRARGWPTRVLLLDDRLPDGSIGSGAGRMLSTVRDLSEAAYAVSVLAVDPGCGDPVQLGRLGVEVLHEDLRTHLRRPEISYELIIISRPNNFESAIATVRELAPMAVVLYDAEAVFHRRLDRQLALLGESYLVRKDAEHTRQIESRICKEVDAIVCISEEEAEIFRGGRGCRVEVVPALDRRLPLTPADWSERSGILFSASWLGGADSPNGDGLRWFAQQVLPLLTEMVPWVHVTVTGRHPPAALRELEGPALHFAGEVRDMFALYDASRAAIVPIRFGAGVKIKAADALAHGVPVVGTSVGLEGIATHGLQVGDTADEPAAFARALSDLLLNRAAWEERRAQLIAWRERTEILPANTWADIVSRVRSKAPA